MPVAVTLNVVLLLSHIVEFDGGTLTTGFFCSVNVAEVDVGLEGGEA